MSEKKMRRYKVEWKESVRGFIEKREYYFFVYGDNKINVLNEFKKEYKKAINIKISLISESFMKRMENYEDIKKPIGEKSAVGKEGSKRCPECRHFFHWYEVFYGDICFDCHIKLPFKK